MGMVVISSTVAVGPIAESIDAEGQPIGDGGQRVKSGFHRTADDLAWWTSAARNHRLRSAPPY